MAGEESSDQGKKRLWERHSVGVGRALVKGAEITAVWREGLEKEEVAFCSGS